MNKTTKILLSLLATVLLVIAAAGFYLSRNLPHMVKEAVETYAPKTTGTPVKLGGVGFNFMTGSVTLKNFVVGNPPGYHSDHSFQFDHLLFQISLPTVFDKIIVIRHFNIDHVNIIAEQHGSITHTNLQEIADHAESVSGSSDNTAPKNKSARQPRLIVSKLAFTNNTVDLVSEALGSRTIKLPDIILTDIGKKEGGLTPDQLTQRITQLVTAQVSDALKDELKKVAKEKAKDTVLDKIKSMF